MRIVFIILFSTFYCQVFSKGKTQIYNTQPGDTIDIVIGLKTNDSQIIQDIKARLIALGNTKLICYCSNLNVFVLRAFKPNYNSQAELFEACQKTISGENQLLLKTGGAKEIVSQCSFSNQDDPAIIKDFLNN
ncbi:MAG: hypothetical protein ABIP51_15400 [Bacteroidia bacterium]